MRARVCELRICRFRRFHVYVLLAVIFCARAELECRDLRLASMTLSTVYRRLEGTLE